VARTGKLFLDNVTLYATLTQFQRQQLIAEGFPGDRIVVVPNMANHGDASEDGVLGDYVGYAGRISLEKGIPTLLDAARKLPEIPFRAAGSYERMPHLPAQASPNFEFLGHLAPEQLEDFYASSRIIALCSTCFEAFPLMLAEAMLRGKPVVCSRLGGLPEIVEDGVTGLLFDAGNTQDLVEKIRYLWDRPDLCRRMGQAGREKALREYSPERYYHRLMAVYEQALERNREATEASPESRVEES
jgi:glycosyltransferase involved in cell wall biosynthesis